jgi:glycosyltransferase involved in cell wall biosynthesis
MKRDLILGLFPELAAVGGIQQMSRHAGAALEEFAAKRNLRCELFGLNDPSGEGSFSVAGRDYRLRGFARNKARLLALTALRARQTRMVFVGHVNLAPVALGMKRLGGTRFLVAVHGMEVWEPLPRLRGTALRRADGIVAVSRHTAEAASRVQRVEREKIAVLSPALDPLHAEPDARPDFWPVPPGSRVLLTVGRLLASEPGKGIDTVIRALAHLIASFPNLYFVVIGDGDGRPALESLAAEAGVAEHVIFLGTRRGSLRGYYEAADVFVMPSRQEGFGIVFLEAMAAAKPVVGAACGGATEVISDGETGYLVNYGDVPALESRLAALLGDDGLRRQMGEAGRRKVESQHRFERFQERLIAILEKLDG